MFYIVSYSTECLVLEVFMLESTIFMKGLYSCEYYSNAQNPNQPIRHVLDDINFTAYPNQIWSILGSSTFEIKLLLEIMANARTYEKGNLMITGYDTPKIKRRILPEVFYIGSTKMAFGNMNVLEYLMFITKDSRMPPVDRQEYLLDYLINADLGYICLTPITLLNDQEKSLIILASAILSASILIIMNIPRLLYDNREINSINKILSNIQCLGKTLIISTQCYDLAQLISSHICYIDKGTVLYNNTLNKFLDEYDNVNYIIEAEDLNYILQSLRLALPQFEYQIEDNIIQVIDNTRNIQSTSMLFHALSAFNKVPNCVQQSKKNIKNSIQRLMKINDL